MLVKIKQANKIAIIDDADFNNDLHIDYDNSIFHVSNSYIELGKTKAELKEKLIVITENRGGFGSLREHDKIIVAKAFATSQINIDSILSKEEQTAIISLEYDVLYPDDSHKSRGTNYFNLFRAELVYKYKKEEYTATDIFVIENLLKYVTAKLVLGDWMSSNALLSTIPITDLFTEEMKSKLQLDFSNYIQSNY